MAKTQYIDIDPATEELFLRGLQSGDRFTIPRVSRKTTISSRKKIKGLTNRSLLPTIAALWAALTDSDRLDWNSASASQTSLYGDISAVQKGAIYGIAQFGVNGYADYTVSSSLSGWRLFVQDMCARIKNSIAGVATPSLLHQVWAGELKISAPATNIKIAQYHPAAYWVSQSVPDHKGMYQPVLVTENFALPLTLLLNYRGELTASGANPSAQFYAEIWSSYQGRDILTECLIDLDLYHDWQNATVSLTDVIGYVVGYTLYFKLTDVRGSLFFDNVRAVHSGQNWVRDTYCGDINQAFTRAFYQIPKHWVAVDIPDGSEYNSIYQDYASI